MINHYCSLMWLNSRTISLTAVPMYHDVDQLIWLLVARGCLGARGIPVPFQWGSKRFGAAKSGVTTVNGSYHNKNHYEPAVTPQVFQTKEKLWQLWILHDTTTSLTPELTWLWSYGSYLQLFQANLRWIACRSRAWEPRGFSGWVRNCRGLECATPMGLLSLSWSIGQRPLPGLLRWFMPGATYDYINQCFFCADDARKLLVEGYHSAACFGITSGYLQNLWAIFWV